jgi:hypothetical protein
MFRYGKANTLGDDYIKKWLFFNTGRFLENGHVMLCMVTQESTQVGQETKFAERKHQQESFLWLQKEMSESNQTSFVLANFNDFCGL